MTLLFKNSLYIVTQQDINIKIWLDKCFSIKDLGETACILEIRIYRDISQKLFGPYQSTYIDKGLETPRKSLCLCLKVCLSKAQCLSTQEKRDQMNNTPYAIASIMYAMLCIQLDVLYALSATNRYKNR
jgi:hypothetical protein